jgi:hypothetical protein
MNDVRFIYECRVSLHDRCAAIRHHDSTGVCFGAHSYMFLGSFVWWFSASGSIHNPDNRDIMVVLI